jgi:hemoglobin
VPTSILIVAKLSLALSLAGFSATTFASTLYDRIGADVLTAVVDEYVDALRADAGTQRSFHKSDTKRVKTMLALQLCDLTGGPCKYDGDSMRDVHAGHGIDHREFYRGVELLREVLARHGVPLRERNELLALLAPMKRDVVDR